MGEGGGGEGVFPPSSSHSRLERASPPVRARPPAHHRVCDGVAPLERKHGCGPAPRGARSEVLVRPAGGLTALDEANGGGHLQRDSARRLPHARERAPPTCCRPENPRPRRFSRLRDGLIRLLPVRVASPRFARAVGCHLAGGGAGCRHWRGWCCAHFRRRGEPGRAQSRKAGRALDPQCQLSPVGGARTSPATELGGNGGRGSCTRFYPLERCQVGGCQAAAPPGPARGPPFASAPGHAVARRPRRRRLPRRGA